MDTAATLKNCLHGARQLEVTMIPRRYGRKLLGAFLEKLAHGQRPHHSDILYYVPVGDSFKGAQGVSSVGVRSSVSRGEKQSDPSVVVMVTRADGAGFPAEITPVQAIAMAEQLKLAARDAVRAATTYDAYARNRRNEGGAA